jgi:GntR family transcriptional regulator, transcriptional repressor for pyruvate dehydrogenase complex
VAEPVLGLGKLTPAPAPSRSAEVTNVLLERLLAGELRRGSRIPSERALAEALGVGRSAIRESLKSLTMLGLLEVRQGDGTYLSARHSSLLPQIVQWGLLLEERSLEDLIEARRHLEITLAGLAASRRTPDDLTALKDALQTMRGTQGMHEQYAEADMSFHLAVAAASQNTVLSDMLQAIRQLLRVWTLRVVTDQASSRASYRLHPPVFTAIKSGDVDAARAAMTRHMDEAERRLRATLASAGDDRL